MKNAVIGNNKQKANLIVLGAVPRYITVKPSFCSKHALIIFKSRHAKTDTTGFFFSVDPCTVRKTYCSSCHFHCSILWLCSPVEKLQLYPDCMCVGFFFCVSLQITVPAPTAHLQSWAEDGVCSGSGKSRHGHREQHQVPCGLSHHPRSSSRLENAAPVDVAAMAFTLGRSSKWHLCFVPAGLLCPDLVFIEACLRCLRTVFISPVTPVQLLYTVGSKVDGKTWLPTRDLLFTIVHTQTDFWNLEVLSFKKTHYKCENAYKGSHKFLRRIGKKFFFHVCCNYF